MVSFMVDKLQVPSTQAQARGHDLIKGSRRGLQIGESTDRARPHDCSSCNGMRMTFFFYEKWSFTKCY